MKTKEEEEYDVNKEVNIQRPSIFPTCPPTTATEGSASQSVGSDDPSPPWSPRTVHALCIRFTSPIKLSMVAIPPWKIASTPPPLDQKNVDGTCRRRSHLLRAWGRGPPLDDQGEPKKRLHERGSRSAAVRFMWAPALL